MTHKGNHVVYVRIGFRSYPFDRSDNIPRMIARAVCKDFEQITCDYFLQFVLRAT